MKNNNQSSEDLSLSQQSRRQFVTKALYASPVLLTLPASPSFAQEGSAAGSGEPPDGGDPGTGGTGGVVDCMPTDPVGGGQVEMCQLSFDSGTGQLTYEDIIVDESEVAGNLANGNLLGTCNSFLCNSS